MKKVTGLAFAFAFCGASLFAQQQSKPVQSDAKATYPTEAAEQEAPAALTKIFSNLGSATNAFTSSGWSLSGPTSSSGFIQYVALPFKPKSNAHASQLRAAVQYGGTGANQIDLSLYTDAGGIPGTLLAGPVTVKNLPVFYTCCKTAIAFIPSTALTAGVQYWIVANTPAAGTGSDFGGAWAFVPPSKQLVGINTGTSWFSFDADIQESAGAVYGTIP